MGIGILVFIYGLLFGSFYNVIIYRVPLDISIARGRSMCPSCGSTLRWMDLLPVLSWVFLKRRCRYCGEKISARYPVIESITAMLFLLAYLYAGLSWEFLVYTSLWSMLLITAMIDMDHMIIADSVLYFFTAAGVIGIAVGKGFILNELSDNLFGLISGFLLYLLIYLGARMIYKKEAFGFGDVMLMGASGAFLGLRFTVLAAILSFYVALIVIMVMKIVGKKIKVSEEIPFGPYICISVFIVSLYGDRLMQMYFDLIMR